MVEDSRGSAVRAVASAAGGHMFGQRGQEDVPVLVTRTGRLILKQPRTRLAGLPALFPQELGDQTPPN
jgi:hypothetical protein